MNMAVSESDRFPTSTEELWRYTNPELFPFRKLTITSTSPKSAWRILDPFGTERALPAGWSFDQNVSRTDPIVRECFETKAGEVEGDAATELQLRAMDSIAVLRITGTTTDPIVLQPIFSAGTEMQVPALIVEVARGASAILVEDLRSPFSGFLAKRLEVCVRPAGRLEWYSLERLGQGARYLSRERFHLERDSRLVTHHVMFGATVSRVDLDCRMIEPNAEAKLSAMYHADGTRHVDLHPSQIHLAPHCRSELSYRGVLHGKGRTVYCGFIRVAELAQKTDAYQSNKNLILSDGARADSIPNLEIRANDVKCSHGSSLGQVGEADLFYLMSRGITREESERLLVEGFWTETIAALPEGPVRDLVQEMVTLETYGSAFDSSEA